MKFKHCCNECGELNYSADYCVFCEFPLDPTYSGMNHHKYRGYKDYPFCLSCKEKLVQELFDKEILEFTKKLGAHEEKLKNFESIIEEKLKKIEKENL